MGRPKHGEEMAARRRSGRGGGTREQRQQGVRVGQDATAAARRIGVAINGGCMLDWSGEARQLHAGEEEGVRAAENRGVGEIGWEIPWERRIARQIGK